ncbi:NAD(P)/FAD-dependent oxidoreductase [Halobaculum magnesiiphilum]|uniref:NAD(P)/FAD-dependent oxidoreductase n=1 Tax=Halobaculum magnesiiphilum TaxID=1017351 RepID=A0A8T8WD68_9EURY|nr:NAD(P)/FAD-dependent oxidoreductase [Halobaculum magnesiiphilum]QZP37788.1 NAD(P)/FAD-dependent oxidoreductase [Halobaculum magnesiiphilum]
MISDDEFDFDVTVVGAGPAGLTSALYATRLGLDTLVVNRGGGRAAMMRDTHNVIGVTEETSGNEFLKTAQEQVKSYGGEYRRGFVEHVEAIGRGGGDSDSRGSGDDGDVDEGDDGAPDGFRVDTGDEELTTRRVVLATGFSDERPDPPLPRTGMGLHYCLHCDAYMFVDESVYVMGTGDSAAYVAMIMLNFTDEVDVLLRGEEPDWSDDTAEMLENHPVDVVREEITGMNKDDDGWLESFEFEDGTVREYKGGFPMYGSDYHAELADALGLEREDSGEVAVDDHGRTSLEGVYAVGDLTPGHNQIPVAMGEGAKCGIAIHMDLRAFPRSTDDIADLGPVDESEVPAVSPELMATAVAHEGHAGGPRADADEVEGEATADD